MASRSQRQRARKAALAANGDGRGGQRSGTPGTAYSNRNDLNATGRAPSTPTTVPHQTYGAQASQSRAMAAVPMQSAAPTIDAQPDPRVAQAARMAGKAAALPGLMDPTARPDEPVTSGAALGPGPGPESLGLASGGSLSPIDEVRAMFAANPSDDLRRLIAYLDGGG